MLLCAVRPVLGSWYIRPSRLVGRRLYCYQAPSLRGALDPVFQHAPARKLLEEHKAHMDSIIQYLQEPLSQFLLNSKAVNVFVEDHWNKLPFESKNALSSCTIEELSMFSKGFVKNNFPESLKSFILKAKELSVLREQMVDSEHICKNKIFNSFKLQAKKEHELNALGPVINSVCKKLDISWCIDIGAGQGYLSQMLVHQYGLNVLALDQSENNIQKSIQMGNKETKQNKRKNNNSNSSVNITNNTPETIVGKYVAAKMKLTNNTTLDEILKLTNETQEDENKMEKFVGKNFLITGLHCCGGLSSTVLRMFSSNLNININNNNNNNLWQMKGLVLLSCCYQLLREQEDITKFQNKQVCCGTQPKEEGGQVTNDEISVKVDFPMSDYVAEKGIALGRVAKVLACYASEKYPATSEQFNKHVYTQGYRAALQVLLLEHYKEFSTSNDTGVGRIGETFTKSFSNFAKHVITAKYKQPLHSILTDEYLEAFWDKYKDSLFAIKIFWSLNCVLAPVLESLILIDRQIFLEENRIPTTLVPIFDPTISPRNVAIIAPY